MNTKVFSFFVFLMFAFGLVARAKELNDERLLEIAQSAFDDKFAIKNQKLGIEVIRRAFEPLDDAQKTRAMMLRIFDLDAKDGGRLRPNPSSSVTNHLRIDPLLVGDPTELKRMMTEESDPRKLYILAAMASHFMDSKRTDFVKELSPMLFRHEPLARMPGEYYVHSLTNSSYFSYGLIVKNLELVGADFRAPDESLSYEERIPVLVEWLRKNWPGCESLGAGMATKSQNPTIRYTPGTELDEPSRTATLEKESSNDSFLRWLFAALVAGFLIVLGIFWRRVFRSRV